MRTLIVTVLVAGGLTLGGDLVAPGTCPVLALGVEDPARQGCCSWHGGVCGCSGVRVVCCDGRLSPSCTCQRPAPGPAV
jgi:hypothetical protein